MKLRTETGKLSFYQWDTNRKLIIEDAPDCQQVHFCHREDANALVCSVREVDGKRVVDVPNILLQQDQPITAYLFCHAEDSTQTRRAWIFQVLGRPKPEGYVYTETEVLNYTNLAERIAQIEENKEEASGGNQSIVLDTTLTVEGAAADAAAVGAVLGEKLSKNGGVLTGKIVLPVGDQESGFTNSNDMKIFGYGAVGNVPHMRIGDVEYPMQLRGSTAHPKYNEGEMALLNDVYTRKEMDTILGSYVDDVAALVGGDA